MTPSPPPEPDEPGRADPPTSGPLAPNDPPIPAGDPPPSGGGDARPETVGGGGATPPLRSPLGVGILLTAVTFLAGLAGATAAALLLNVARNPPVELKLLSLLVGHGLGTLVGIQCLLLFRRATCLSYRQLGLPITGDIWRRIGRGLGIYAASLPGYLVLALVMRFIGERYGFTYEQPDVQGILKGVSGNPGALALFFLVAAVGAPLWEEMLFRGLLYPAVRYRFGLWAAVGVTAFSFALMHETSRVIQDPRTFLVPIFYLGVVLALIRERTESLVPAMAVHALHNFIALTVTLNYQPMP